MAHYQQHIVYPNRGNVVFDQQRMMMMVHPSQAPPSMMMPMVASPMVPSIIGGPTVPIYAVPPPAPAGSTVIPAQSTQNPSHPVTTTANTPISPVVGAATAPLTVAPAQAHSPKTKSNGVVYPVPASLWTHVAKSTVSVPDTVYRDAYAHMLAAKERPGYAALTYPVSIMLPSTPMLLKLAASAAASGDGNGKQCGKKEEELLQSVDGAEGRGDADHPHGDWEGKEMGGDEDESYGMSDGNQTSTATATATTTPGVRKPHPHHRHRQRGHGGLGRGGGQSQYERGSKSMDGSAGGSRDSWRSKPISAAD